jgi:hypothetical protein
MLVQELCRAASHVELLVHVLVCDWCCVPRPFQGGPLLRGRLASNSWSYLACSSGHLAPVWQPVQHLIRAHAQVYIRACTSTSGGSNGLGRHATTRAGGDPWKP